MNTKMSKKYEIDMTNGSITGKMLIFALPLMLSGILQLLFNAADVIVVGRFAGENALAAVGSCGSLINLLINLFIGISTGTNVVSSRYYGSKKFNDLSKAVHTSMLLSFIGGIILTVVGFFAAKKILLIMQVPPEVLPLSVTYVQIYFLGMTATMVYNFGSAILRSIGDTKRPLYFLFIAGIINVILNLIFVIVFDMSVAGVALATVISQFVSATLVVICLIKSDSPVKLNLKELKIHKKQLILILKLGLPAGIQGTVFSLSNVVIQSSINSFGNISVAGNSAAANVEGFIYVAMNAFYQSALSFTSQNLGAKKYDRIKKVLFIALMYVLLTGILLGSLVTVFDTFFLGLYTDNPNVVIEGIKRFSIVCRFYFLCGLMDVMCGMLRGLGASLMPMIVSLVGACGLRLLWVGTVFQLEQFHSLESLYVSYPFTWAVTLIAHTVTFIIMYRNITIKSDK